MFFNQVKRLGHCACSVKLSRISGCIHVRIAGWVRVADIRFFSGGRSLSKASATYLQIYPDLPKASPLPIFGAAPKALLGAVFDSILAASEQSFGAKPEMGRTNVVRYRRIATHYGAVRGSRSRRFS
ncbi:hypothetical protein ACTXGQ_11615 [Marinobacter sp. 1Y8]